MQSVSNYECIAPTTRPSKGASFLLAASCSVRIQQVDDHSRLGRGRTATAWSPLASCQGCSGTVTIACRGCLLRLPCRQMRCAACEHPNIGRLIHVLLGDCDSDLCRN